MVIVVSRASKFTNKNIIKITFNTINKNIRFSMNQNKYRD